MMVNKLIESAKDSSGYLLVEILVAIAVVTVVATVMVNRITDSIAINQLAANRSTASRLAEEASEWMKGIYEEQGWVVFTDGINLLTNSSKYACWQPGTTGMNGNTLPFNETVYISPSHWPVYNGTALCSSADADVISNLFSRQVVLTRDPATPDQINYSVTVRWNDKAARQFVVEGVLYR